MQLAGKHPTTSQTNPGGRSSNQQKAGPSGATPVSQAALGVEHQQSLHEVAALGGGGVVLGPHNAPAGGDGQADRHSRVAPRTGECMREAVGWVGVGIEQSPSACLFC